MNKAQLVDAVAGRLGSRRAATDAVDAVLDTIVRALADGEPVSVTGFGRFETVEQAERLARNPQTGQTVHIAARMRPRFRPGQNLLDLVDGAKPLPQGSAIAKAEKGSLMPGGVEGLRARAAADIASRRAAKAGAR
jgi:DNA-binding protein HU-beta